MRNTPIWRVAKAYAGKLIRSVSFSNRDSDGSLGTRRYGGSNFAELELSSRNQDSGTSGDKRPTTCPLKKVIVIDDEAELTTNGSEIIANGCEAAC